MDVEQPDRSRSSTVAPPAHWPAKTRRLVDDVRQLCREWLSEPLKLCLEDFDRALHEQAASTRSHVEKQRYQATRQRLVQERRAFEQRFIDGIDQWLAERLHADDAHANQNLPRLARLAEVWEKIVRAARDTETYNLERKPLVFSVFGWLADATR